jgi:hypothetical protein
MMALGWIENGDSSPFLVQIVAMAGKKVTLKVNAVQMIDLT